MNEYLTLDEASQLLRRHKESIRRYVAAGRLRAYEIPGLRGKRFRRADIEALLQPVGGDEAPETDGTGGGSGEADPFARPSYQRLENAAIQYLTLTAAVEDLRHNGHTPEQLAPTLVQDWRRAGAHLAQLVGLSGFTNPAAPQIVAERRADYAAQEETQ